MQKPFTEGAIKHAKKQAINLLETEKNKNQSVILFLKYEFKLIPSLNFDHIKPVEAVVLRSYISFQIFYGTTFLHVEE